MWGISYWVFPVVSGVVWVGMLIAMLVTWCVEGKPHYASMEAGQNIAYISDVGADILKPLFIAGACVTTVFLDLSFLSERWLRHSGRLDRNTTTAEKVLSGFSMVFALIGTAGLILLSIFDTLRHPRLHDIFLLLFIVGYVVSAIFICAEYQRLGIHYRQHRILRVSFWIKLFFILIEVVLAIAFAVCNFKSVSNAAAVLEWAVAFIFTFYVFSFFIDLIPAVHSKHYASKETAMSMETNDAASRQQTDQYGMDGMNVRPDGANYYGDGGRSGARTPNGVNGHNAAYGNTTNGVHSHQARPTNGQSGQNEFVVNNIHYVNGANGAVQVKPDVANNF